MLHTIPLPQPQNQPPSADRPQTVKFAVRHSIPGRIRLHVPSLVAGSSWSESLLTWLGKQEGITDVRANYDCAGLVVEYDRESRAAAGEARVDDVQWSSPACRNNDRLTCPRRGL